MWGRVPGNLSTLRSLKWHFSKCHLRFISLLWVSNDTFQNVIWDSDASFETQMTLFKMSSEIQIPPLRLKWHFSKCHLKSRSLLWVSNDTFQNVIWDSYPSFETQMTLLRMSFEIQIPPLSLGWHFKKMSLRFKCSILNNVFWDSKFSWTTIASHLPVLWHTLVIVTLVLIHPIYM